MNPKKAFDDQKRHAKDREIPFLLSYAEWLEMWLVSGQWFKRGKGKGQYVMARFGDEGAYSTRNCRVCPIEVNQQERWEGKKIEDELVSEIIHMYKNTNDPQWLIGERYGISQSHVSRLISGKRRSTIDND